MSNMFYNSNFNGDLSKWDVFNVNEMYQTFMYSKFNNDSLNNWNMKNVENIHSIFGFSEFVGNISNWELNNNIDADMVFANNEKFYEKYKENLFSKKDFFKWLSERKLEQEILETSNSNVYIDIKSKKYNDLSIDDKIKVLNNNIKILNKDFDDNCLVLQLAKIEISKKVELNPSTKLLVYNEFEKKCREANTTINESIEKNQIELENQNINKELKETKIDFDVFKTR